MAEKRHLFSNQWRTWCQQLYGFDTFCIILPLTNIQFLRELQNSTEFQISFADDCGKIGDHYLAGKLCDFFSYELNLWSQKLPSLLPFHRQKHILLMDCLMVERGFMVQILNLLIFFLIIAGETRCFDSSITVNT